MKCYFFATVLLFSLVFTARMSFSICWNTAENLGFAVCMRLLLARARLSASFSISISAAVNMLFVSCV